MELKLNKFLPLAGLLCLCSMSSAQAGSDDDYQKPAGQMQMDSNGSYKEITPNAGPRVTDGVDVAITADFIYWYTEQDGMGYAITGFGDGTTSASSGKVYQTGGNWEPGFKVGLGLGLGHDGWDLNAEYTWLQMSTSGSVTASDIYPMWNIANAYNSPTHGTVTSASNNTNFHFNVIDLELGRNYYISQHLTLRPFAGLKGSWQTQKYNVEYTQSATIREMSNNQKYWAVGLRSGMNTAWHFTKEWSIFGDMALSALWANFKVTRTDETGPNPEVETSEVAVFSTKSTVNTVKPVLEMALGLRWETWFSDNDYHFMIQAGWEEQIWFSMNQQLHLNEQAAHGDLGLQGLTIKVRFDF